MTVLSVQLGFPVHCPGVLSVKGPESIKRRESISSEIPPPSTKPATPAISMDSSIPQSPAITGKIVPDPALRKGKKEREREICLTVEHLTKP